MRKRFTLLELLLVISIIALLSGMLLGAIAAVKRHAMQVETKSKITELMLAINSYHTAYHTLPMAGAIASDRTLSPSEYDTLLRCLMADPSRPDLNPRKLRFLNYPETTCRDAWAQEFSIAMDFDYDGQVADGAIHGYLTGDLATNIAIWSKGRDRSDDPLDSADNNTDNVTSWKR